MCLRIHGSYSQEKILYKDLAEFLLPYSFLGFFFHTSLLNYDICETLRCDPGTRHEGGKYQEQISAVAKHKLTQPVGRWARLWWINTGLFFLHYCLGLFLGRMRHFLKLLLHPTWTLSLQAGVLCKSFLPFMSLGPTRPWPGRIHLCSAGHSTERESELCSWSCKIKSQC